MLLEKSEEIDDEYANDASHTNGSDVSAGNPVMHLPNAHVERMSDAAGAHRESVNAIHRNPVLRRKYAERFEFGRCGRGGHFSLTPRLSRF